MKKIERLHYIYQLLKKEKLTSDEILVSLNKKERLGIRQFQRDFKDIPLILNGNEKLITYRNSNRIKSFQIVDKLKHNNSRNTKEASINSIRKTNFFTSKLMLENEDEIKKLEQTIIGNNSILIKKLHLDSTGDNYLFTQRNIQFKPLELLFHRGTYYVGGYNIRKKIIQIFEVNQIKEYEYLKSEILESELKSKLDNELKQRFGVSKNINEDTYTIKLKFSSVTGNFIMNHFWHSSQSFEVKKGKVIMTLQCGINRELIGWIFYWMYNVKIIEPPILIDYYHRTLEEINLVNSTDYPLVYRNIFYPKK